MAKPWVAERRYGRQKFFAELAHRLYCSEKLVFPIALPICRANS